MARRKNTKIIDPRYFLSETAYRDLEEELEKVIENVPNPEFRDRAQAGHSDSHASDSEKCRRIQAVYNKYKEENPRSYGYDGDMFEQWVERTKREHPECLPEDA